MPNDKLPAPRALCGTCAAMLDQEYAMQKYGWPADDTHLPPAASRLKIVRDFRPHDSRALQLRQCPECATYYLYRTDYEYLVNGSEDEEFLTRLSADEAKPYLT